MKEWRISILGVLVFVVLGMGLWGLYSGAPKGWLQPLISAWDNHPVFVGGLFFLVGVSSISPIVWAIWKIKTDWEADKKNDVLGG